MGTTLQNGGERFLHGWEVLRADSKPCPNFLIRAVFRTSELPWFKRLNRFRQVRCLSTCVQHRLPSAPPAPTLVKFQLTHTVAVQQYIYNGDRVAVDFVTKSAAGDLYLRGMVLC